MSMQHVENVHNTWIKYAMPQQRVTATQFLKYEQWTCNIITQHQYSLAYPLKDCSNCLWSAHQNKHGSSNVGWYLAYCHILAPNTKQVPYTARLCPLRNWTGLKVLHHHGIRVKSICDKTSNWVWLNVYLNLLSDKICTFTQIQILSIAVCRTFHGHINSFSILYIYCHTWVDLIHMVRLDF